MCAGSASEGIKPGTIDSRRYFCRCFQLRTSPPRCQIPPSKPWFTYDCYSIPLEKAVSIVLFEPSLGEKLEFENPCRIWWYLQQEHSLFHSSYASMGIKLSGRASHYRFTDSWFNFEGGLVLIFKGFYWPWDEKDVQKVWSLYVSFFPPNFSRGSFFCIFLGTATARIEPTAVVLSQPDCPGVRDTV